MPTGKCPKRVRKPSRYVRDLLDGYGITTASCVAPLLPPGLQPPSSSSVDDRHVEGESVDGREGWDREEDDNEGRERAEVKVAILMEDAEGDWWEYAMLTEMSASEGLEPRSLAEAKRRPDWVLWEKVIKEELSTLKEAGTWEVAEAPAGANVVGSKWVFKAKRDASGNVVRYKAQLVTQGFSQIPSVDYFDTYAPVAKLASVRTVLTITNRHNFELHQVDIKGAYLNGDLTPAEVIFMCPPPGYAPTGTAGKVLRLHRTLYGLKQSGRRWYQKLTSIFVGSMGFT